MAAWSILLHVSIHFCGLSEHCIMESRRFVLVQKWLGGQPLAREDVLLWVFDGLI